MTDSLLDDSTTHARFRAPSICSAQRASRCRIAAMPDPRAILIHTFITRDFLPWCELLLESLRYQHGERMDLRIDAVNLEPDDVNFLERVYTNMEIHNHHVDWRAVMQQMNVGDDILAKWNDQLRHGHITDTNFPMKLFISVDQRYRRMEALLNEARSAGYAYVLHTDADTYIRKPLNPIFDVLADHDLCLFLRSHKERDSDKVWGGFLGFHLTGNLDRFVSRWMRHIDAVPSEARWRGFGQSVLWYAYRESPDVAMADLSTMAGTFKFSKTFERDAGVWMGNSQVGIAPKTTTLERAWRDLKTGYPRIPAKRMSSLEYLSNMDRKTLGKWIRHQMRRRPW